VGVGVAGEGLAGALEALEGRPRRVPDVEAVAGARQVALAVPADVAPELVDGVEAAGLDQALGEAERHRGVVGPCANWQPVRPAAHHVGERCEGAGLLELDRRADGVADRQADQRAPIAVLRADAAHPKRPSGLRAGAACR
jgi:hypothetical protein